MYPLVLDLKDRLCVIVGFGSVGRRKADKVLECGGRVRVVCLEEQPAQETPGVEWICQPYCHAHLEGASLVFAAASPEVNRQVVKDATNRKIWVNAADEPKRGDFSVPATLRRGNFLIAVSTGGAAPMLAREIRAQLESQFDDAFGRLVALLEEIRPAVLVAGTDAGQRHRLLERLCRLDWLNRLRTEPLECVRRAMLEEVRNLAGPIENQV
jgi:precorrin-2 dehydrogenase/sirohydrochlorin ferrochelatase